MSSRRNKLSLFVLGCALALSASGCRAPWSGSGDKSSAANRLPTFARATSADSSTASAAGAVAKTQRTGGVTPAPTAAASEATTAQSAPADNAEMAGVLEKLQEVGELDPAAQAKLIEKLHGTKPEYWPLVAEQFRASLAYHQQLLAKDSTSPPLSAVGKTSNPVGASTPIGALVDPRGVRPDATPDEALASSPTVIALAPREEELNQLADDPAAPREFAAQGATFPITSATSADRATPAVLPVSLDVPVTPAGKDVANVATSAVKAESAADWQKLVAKAAEDLSQHVAASPATTAEVHQHVSLRILRLLTGDTEKALEPIPHISPVEQDYWSRQLFALATYLDHFTQPDDKRRAAASVVHLDEAAASLHELGSLSLRNLTFCKEVYDYGAYEPYEHDHFAPGQQLSLYVEVDNFHSQSTEKGFCTSLGSTYELLNEAGVRVDGGEFPDVEDCCRSRRRDFHVQYGLALPKAIPPGKYQLQLVVRDRGSDKIGHATAAFEVAGGKK